METELEAKWLNADHDELRRKLNACGATLVRSERLMTRRVYDFADKRLDAVGGWVRVRDEGNKITMSYKQLVDRSLEGTKEVNVSVDDFAKTCQFLESIGLVSKSYQETKRESWKLGSVEIELDTWPWIPPFVEIEAQDKQSLQDVAQKLNLHLTDAFHGSVETAYQAVYDVTEAEINSWDVITFSDTPDWLTARKKPQ